jgi:hypothetical protein
MNYDDFAKEFIGTAVDQGYDSDKLNTREAIEIAWMALGRMKVKETKNEKVSSVRKKNNKRS